MTTPTPQSFNPPAPAALAVMALLLTAEAQACDGPPPPPACGKTLAVALAVPDTLLLPDGGGTFTVSTLVYFNLVDNPPGSGICPVDPASATVTVTADCEGTSDGSGSTAGVALTPGEYTPTAVQVSVPDGPPRQCELWAEATVALSDGMTLTNDSHSMACIGEPSPIDPGLPRLDLIMIGEPGSERARVHPGSQAGYWYRLTNNDDDQSFSGVVTLDSTNASRQPTAIPAPGPTGTGPFAVSDPSQGDNFPVSFPDGLDSTGCVPLPPDPLAQTVSSDTQQVDNLAPGDSTDLHFFSRPWGMCPNGSCGNIKIVAEGNFDGPEAGFACAGVLIAADTSAPPKFFWPDSGQTVRVVPTGELPPTVALDGEPSPDTPVQIPIELIALELTGAQPIDIGTFPQIAPFSNQRDEHVRMGLQIFPGSATSLFPAGQEVTLHALFRVAPPPSAPIETELVSMQLTGGPTNFTGLSPTATGRVALLPGPSIPVDSFFDFVYQVSAVGFDETAQARDIVIDSIAVVPIDSQQFEVTLTGTAEPGAGTQIQEMMLHNDFRGFSGSGEVVFSDGIESGLDFGAVVLP